MYNRSNIYYKIINIKLIFQFNLLNLIKINIYLIHLYILLIFKISILQFILINLY